MTSQMSESFPWYASAGGSTFEHGDTLFDCPYVHINATGEAVQSRYHVIILSHSCDLANDKLEVVQVCPLWTLRRLADKVPYLRARKGKEDLRRGNLSGYHLRNECNDFGVQRGFPVVDFRSLFGIHQSMLNSIARPATCRPTENTWRRLPRDSSCVSACLSTFLPSNNRVAT